MKTLRPSSAARRMQCPASYRLEAAITDTEVSEVAQEGIDAHAQAAKLLIELRDKGEVDLDTSHVSDYVRYVRSIIHEEDSSPIAPILFIEKHLQIPILNEFSAGTPDLVYMAKNSSGVSTIHIVDFKYGFTPVSAYENWQLLSYAAAYSDWSTNNFTLHIFQPRAHNGETISVWHLTRKELLKYIVRLQESESLALTEDAPAITGPECHGCKARASCKALRNAAGAVATTVREPELELTDVQAAVELAYLEESARLLTARKIALEERVKLALVRGAEVPFYKLQKGRGKEVWIVDSAMVASLGDLYKVQMRKFETITPLQAIKAGVPAEVVRNYTVKIQGALQMRKT